MSEDKKLTERKMTKLLLRAISRTKYPDFDCTKSMEQIKENHTVDAVSLALTMCGLNRLSGIKMAKLYPGTPLERLERCARELDLI